MTSWNALSVYADDATLTSGATISHTEHNTHRTNVRNLDSNFKTEGIATERHHNGTSAPDDTSDGVIWSNAAATPLLEWRQGGVWENIAIATRANTFTGINTFSSATASTSISTGAIVLSGAAGGLGMAGALWVGGLANIAGAMTLQSALTISVTGSPTTFAINLTGATSRTITFGAGAAAVPAYTTRSAGTKIVLYEAIGASAADYAVGLAGNEFWSSVPTTSQHFSWYLGTAEAARLDGSSNFHVNGVSAPAGAPAGLFLLKTGAVMGTAATGFSMIGHVATDVLTITAGATTTGKVSVTNTLDATSSTASLATAGGLYVGKAANINGVLRVGSSSTAGVVGLGDTDPATSYVGIARGTSAGVSGGNVLLLGGYAGVGITAGANVLYSQGAPKVFFDTSGNTLIGVQTAPTALAVGIASVMTGAVVNSAALADGATAVVLNDGASLAAWHFVTERLTVHQLANAGINTLQVGGVIGALCSFTTTTKAGATGVLKTATIPANTLEYTGKALRITTWGTKSGANAQYNIDARTGTTPTSRISYSFGVNETTWTIRFLVVRTGATTANLLVVDNGSGANSVPTYAAISTDTNWAASQVIDLNISSINASDTVTQEGLLIEVLN